MGQASFHRAYGRVLWADFELPELDRAEPESQADLRITCAPAAALPAPDRGLWPHAFSISDQPWLLYRCDALTHTLLFPDQACFELRARGREIRVQPGPSINPPALRHLLLDQVIPLALSLRFQPVLHASAVVSPWGAVGFLGESGRGKSTTALHLARQGWPLLSDDGLVLESRSEGFSALPSYPAVRLWPDTAGPLLGDLLSEALPSESDPMKRRLRLPASVPVASGPARLSALFLLDRQEGVIGPRLTPVSGPDATVALLRHSFRLELVGRERAADDFGWQSSLAASVPMRRLIVADDLSGLTGLSRLLESFLRASSAP